MIAHLVLFRPRASVDAAARRALADAFADAIRDIASVRAVRFGRRVTHGRPYEQLMREDYPYAAILEFDDLAGLREYLEHPAHERLAECFFARVEQALMYDYDLADDTSALDALVSGSS